MKVNIIIPVHNQSELLCLCIESIYKHTKTDFIITIVNDGSDDKTTKYCKMLLDCGKIYKIIHNLIATGFTNSCNEGIISSPICDYYCFLNSDTIVVTDNWIEKIIDIGEKNKDIGCIGVLSNNATIQSVGKKYLKKNEIENYGNWITSISDNIFPMTTFINGFCFFIKYNIVEKVGLLDYDNFPHYGSEDDYILRIRDNGYNLVIADNVYVYHYSNQSYGNKREGIVKKSFSVLCNKWGINKIKEDSIFSESVLKYLRIKIDNLNYIDIGNKKKIVTAITTYNRLEYLKRCIESWDKTRDKKYEWILVITDDGSTDGTIEYLKSLNIKGVKKHLILNNRMGVHYQTNQILKYCSNIDFEYGFKTDDDIIYLKEGWDNKYIEAIEKSGYDHLCFYDYNWGQYRLSHHLLNSSDNGLLISRVEKENVQGAFWTFSKRVIDKVGYFDIDNFGFCGLGHVDYTCRCARAGFNDYRHPYDMYDSNNYIKLPREKYKSAITDSERYSFNTKEIIEYKKNKIQEDRVYIPYKENSELIEKLKQVVLKGYIKTDKIEENKIISNIKNNFNSNIINTKRINKSLKTIITSTNVRDDQLRSIGYWLRNLRGNDNILLNDLVEEMGWGAGKKFNKKELEGYLNLRRNNV